MRDSVWAMKSTEPGIEGERDSSWREDAACKDTPTAVFFPRKGDASGLREARALCAGCPVRVPCAEYALANRIFHGVWGGLSGRDRRPAARRAS